LFADFPIMEVDGEETEQAIVDLEAIVGRQEITNSQQLLDYGMFRHEYKDLLGTALCTLWHNRIARLNQ